MANDSMIKITKDGITRVIPANEIYDYRKRGWLAEGDKKIVDADALEKELSKANDKAAKALAELDKAKADKAALTAELDKAKKSIEKLTAELDKAKADNASK